MPSGSTPLSPHLTCSPTGSSPNPVLWVSMEASLQRYDGLHHWLLVINQLLVPLSSGEIQVWGSKFHSSNHKAGSPGNQVPSLGDLEVFQKSLHNVTKDNCMSHHLGNPKGFRSSVAETRLRLNVYLL